MTPATHPLLFVRPTAVGAVPCFGVGDAPPNASGRPRVLWDAACTDVLMRSAGRLSNPELADLIAAQTGKRFSSKTVSERRAALGLEAPSRNAWTAPLQRWKPWSVRASRRQA